MQDSEIIVGKRYAVRLKVSGGEPLLKVQILEKVGRRRMVKVRHLGEPHVGLEEYVQTRQIIVPWKEQKAFLRDEERLRRLVEVSPGPGLHARREAVSAVLESTGYPSAYADKRGIVEMDAEELRQIAGRAGLPPSLEDLHRAAFVDRHGRMHLPLDLAEQLAKAFAAAEPKLVLMYLDDVETEYRIEGSEPGKRYIHDLLREYEAGFALARQWAGHEQEVAYLRGEIERLRSLVNSAIDTLARAGEEGESARLRRALSGK